MASSSQAGSLTLKEAGERPISLRTFTGFVVLAGLVNAAIVAFIFCRLPASHHPTLHSLFLRAFLYVACASLAGVGGARFYWNQFSVPFTTAPPLSFAHFALVNAAAWVWVPAIVLLSRQDSPASSALSAVGAALLATGLRRFDPSGSRHPDSSAPEFDRTQLFAATLRTAPREAHGFVIALSLYATGYFLLNHFYLNAGAPFALAAFLFTWKLTLERYADPSLKQVGDPARTTAVSNPDTRAAALRLAPTALAALLVTLFCLLFGIDHRNDIDAARAALANNGDQSGESNAAKDRRPGSVLASGISGYQSIILWPVPQKQQIVAPVHAPTSPFADRAAKPVILRFDGPYWYVQPPNQRPGPAAHQAQGNPLGVNIEANNFLPLNMSAIEHLGDPVRLSRCREIQVAIENRDNLRGAIDLDVLLTDTSAPGHPSLALGPQTVISSQPAHFTVKATPAYEVLRFPIPAHANLRKFDQITVVFLPDTEHWQLGAKIAVEQFQLLPR